MFKKILGNLQPMLHPITAGGVPLALATLVAIYSLSVVTSLPGLAVSPILDQLRVAFPLASETEIQMLESLPSLLIIPFILLAGKLSMNLPKRKLLISGLGLFALSSVLYLLPVGGIGYMLFNSVLLGVGAGMVIPLSTGLVADYFSGKERTRQLGIVSGISNLSLVLATALAGYLADISWHAAFLVYALSAISLFFSFRIKEPPKPIGSDGETASSRVELRNYPWRLMGLYFILTTVALVVPFNLSILLQYFKIGGSEVSGNLISIFFLSITLPGFFITYLIKRWGARLPIYALGMLTLGSMMLVFGFTIWLIFAGVLCLGLGYGALQPLIYDTTSTTSKPIHVTYFLALVMAMNYSAIIIYPFFQAFLVAVIPTSSPLLPFWASFVIVTILGYYYWKLNKKSVILHS